MGTECSYDYVFVYDGDSFDAPLLGSFSGKTDPQNVTASSGYVSYLLIQNIATNKILYNYINDYIFVTLFRCLFYYIVILTMC